MKKTILVVDDHEAIRLLGRTILEYEGYNVVEAADGKEALASIEQSKPDLVLLDLQMPNMNGWELLEELRKDEATASIPVVLFTAQGDDATQLKAWAEEPNVVDFLAKPFSEIALTSFVNRAFAEFDPEAERNRREAIRDELQRKTEKYDRDLTNQTYEPDEKFG